MAYYEFECEECSERFDVKQSYAEHDYKPNPRCPNCGSEKVGQLVESIHVKTSKKS